MRTLKKAFGATLGLTFVFVLASLFTHNDSHAAKKAASSAPARGYYLTATVFADGSQASSACVVGYHMASLWEIHEPSNLRYDQDPVGDGTNLGLTELDSGQGPPTGQTGWARTGGASPFFNCAGWTTNSSAGLGSIISLTPVFSSPALTASPWDFSRMSCDTTNRVWCVQD